MLMPCPPAMKTKSSISVKSPTSTTSGLMIFARGYMTTSSPIIDLAWSDVPGLIMYVYDNTYSGWTCRIGSMWLTYVSD